MMKKVQQFISQIVRNRIFVEITPHEFWINVRNAFKNF